LRSQQISNSNKIVTIQRLSLVPWLCRGMPLVRLSLTSSRIFAPFLCAYRFGVSCVSGGGATQLGEQLIAKNIQILLNVALHVQLRFATNHASSGGATQLGEQL